MIQPLLNKSQSASNLLSATGPNACCGDTLETLCSNVITHTEANTATVLIIQEAGTNKSLTLTPGGTSAILVQAAIVAALKAAGYVDDGKGTEGVTVVDNGSTHTVTITGYVKVVSMTTSGGSESATQKCTQKASCTYTAKFGGGTTPAFVVNGASANLSTITYGTTSTSAVSSAVTTALSNAGITPTVAVATVDDTANSQYIITFGYNIDNHFSIGGVEFGMGSCAHTWTT